MSVGRGSGTGRRGVSRRKKSPHRQPRGPRATAPAPEPRPERPSAHDYMSGAACDGCCNWADECECHLWHAYKECLCGLVAHRDRHPAADCPCPSEEPVTELANTSIRS